MVLIGYHSGSPVLPHGCQVHLGVSQTGEDAQGQVAVRGIFHGERPPRRVIAFEQLGPASQPGALFAPQLGCERAGVFDQAQEERQVSALRVGQVVHINGSRLDQDRAEAGATASPWANGQLRRGDRLAWVRAR